MAKKNKEHDHDPRRCHTCRKLREVWASNGFCEAFQMLKKYYEEILWPRVRKLWRTLPADFRGHEVLRMADDSWDSNPKKPKRRKRAGS